VNFLRRLKGPAASRAPEPRRRLLFVLGGASHNWRGPGRELYRAEPAFREAIDPADTLVRARLGFSSTAMFSGEWTARSPEEQRRSDLLNMGLLHLGLIDLWAAKGIRPDGLLGLSLGEVGSAYASGAIDRPTAFRIYCAIAAHIDARSDEHILFVVEAGADAALALCAASPAPVHFAGEPVPGNSALLAPVRHGDEVRAWLGRGAVMLDEHSTKWPYHVPTGAFDERGCAAELAGMAWRSPELPVYLASLGRRTTSGDGLGGGHWASMCADPYFLAGASRAAFDDGFDLIVNIGTASIGEWVAAAAPAGADVRRFDATPGGPGAQAWKSPLKAIAALHPPAPPVDPVSAGIPADPFLSFERLRAAGPVQFLPQQNFWIVLGYDEVEAALRDTGRLSNSAYARVGPVLMAQDPPDHLHVRRLLSTLFAPAQTARYVGSVRDSAAGLIGGRFDLVAGYARPLAQAVAFDLLSIPPSAEPLFRDAAEHYQERGRDIGAYVERLDAVAGEAGLLREILSRADGLLTEERGRQLVRFLWMAATETSERAIVRAMLVLLRDPALRARIEEDPSRIEPFVDEVLRLYPPEMMVPRKTAAPVRLGGADIPAGHHVMLCLAAANRDPACFDEPAAIRLDRPPGRHLSFGAGIHKCSGTAMSRPIVVAALEALLRGAPSLRADEPLGELGYYSTITVHTPRRLLVAQ
jgi:cytochrome P450